ncbi:MAG TPA: hypothetical protein VKO87_12280 [Gemmatimonadaceae bacterium]|nr:hypothetical protein [Gemmatimonadaceae bacterium]
MNLTRSKFFQRSLVIAFAGVLVGGCTDFSSPKEQLGRLIVTAKDASGTGVQGIKFTLLLSDRSTPWAAVSTSADGSAEFRANDGGVLPQTYIVRFDAINGAYVLGPSETNDKPVQVVNGQTQTVTFTVVKQGPSGP